MSANKMFEEKAKLFTKENNAKQKYKASLAKLAMRRKQGNASTALQEMQAALQKVMQNRRCNAKKPSNRFTTF